jgi:hypothetical protein
MKLIFEQHFTIEFMRTMADRVQQHNLDQPKFSGQAGSLRSTLFSIVLSFHKI